MNGYNFTPRVRQVLAAAREEAARLGHEYVGTEHILLGLVREDEGGAASVIRNLGIDGARVRQDVERAVTRGTSQPSAESLPYTSRAKKSLELSMGAARELYHSYVGTEHLLLGILLEGKGIGAMVLNAAGLTTDEAATEVARITGVEPRPITGAPGPIGTRPGPRTEWSESTRVRSVTLEILLDDGSTLRARLPGVGEAVAFLRDVR